MNQIGLAKKASTLLVLALAFDLAACGDDAASLPPTPSSSSTTSSTATAGGQQAGSSTTTGQGGQTTTAQGSGGSNPTGGGGSGGSAPCTPGSGTEPVGNDSVLDKATCLVWQKTEGASKSNKQAAKHCDQLVQDGFDDWRVPEPQEMATWPNLTSSANAYITSPTYIPKTASSTEEGCKSNAHSCNLAKYSMSGPAQCAWQGVGFKGPVVCVRGTPVVAALPMELMASQCSSCKTHVGANADYQQADCIPFAD